MSYQALYRKYRPKTFSDVVGQENTIMILKNSIINHKFSHAYLFSGSKGTGKTSVAKILAKTINCQSNNNGEACNQCASCQLITLNSDNIDIIEIDGASNNGVDEIRNIRNNINILPMNLKYKVYIIDEVHMLTTAAFNALLKTLEEPPKHIIFIFATTEPHKIPLTIISRCQWFEFKRINCQDLQIIMNKILALEAVTYETAAILEIALLSDGSLRDAINNLEKAINFNKEVTLKSVNNLFSIITKEDKIVFLINLFNHNISILLKKLNEFNNYINDFNKVVIDLIYLIQDILIYRLTEDSTNLKFLTQADAQIFSPVETGDLKVVLAQLDEIITLNLANNDLKAILMVRILKLVDQLNKHQLQFKQTIMPVIESKVYAAEKVAVTDQVAVEPPITGKTAELTEDLDKIVVNKTLFNEAINVIVQADKEIRKTVKHAWVKINELIANNKFRNFSKIYLNTVISAACPNGIVIICDNIIQADLINKKFLYQEYRNFLNFVLGQDYMIYALDKKQWKLIGKKYQELAKQNNLPKAKPITIIPASQQESKTEKSKTLTFLQDIFSEIEEI